MMTEQQISPEVMEAEFQRFATMMDIDVYPASGEEAATIAQIKAALFRSMERGSLVFDEKGQPVLKTSTGDTLVFHEPTGSSLIAMEGSKKAGSHAKLFHLCAAVTGKPTAYFEALPQRDVRVVTRIMTLFLA